jgi:hypothetical protein
MPKVPSVGGQGRCLRRPTSPTASSPHDVGRAGPHHAGSLGDLPGSPMGSTGSRTPRRHPSLPGLRLERRREDCFGSSSFGCPAVGPLSAGALFHPPKQRHGSVIGACGCGWGHCRGHRHLASCVRESCSTVAWRCSGVLYTSSGATRSSVQVWDLHHRQYQQKRRSGSHRRIVSTFDSNWWDSGLGAAMSYICDYLCTLQIFFTDFRWLANSNSLVAGKCTSIHKTTIYFISAFHAN